MMLSKAKPVGLLCEKITQKIPSQTSQTLKRSNPPTQKSLLFSEQTPINMNVKFFKAFS